MSPSLKVIALISGGKDSLFSILHCLAHGHTIIALANLHPPTSSQEESEDLDSFMYQTVGHTLIPLYANALDLPLYRQEIHGSAVNASREYSEAMDDETESLIPLLRRVKEVHPEANAVCTGAIFSTYQRTRVENVATRLELTSLAYLWQYPMLPPYTQSSLLCDMRAVGQEARIIKVASAGLDESFLWEDVADVKTVERMKRAMGRFSEGGDGALVGEGGEFETLAVDGPGVLWKRRVVVEEEGTVVLGGGTAVWKGRGVGVEGKVDEKNDEDEGLTGGRDGEATTHTDSFSTKGLEKLRRPPLFDEEFAKLLHTDDLIPQSTINPDKQSPEHLPPSETQRSHAPDAIHTEPSTLPKPLEPSPLSPSRPSLHATTFHYPNITGETLPPSTSSTPTTQLTNILLRLSAALTLHSLPPQSMTHCTLLLRSMSLFTPLNTIYGKYFSYTTPPSRVTVAIGDAMPDGFDVMLSVVGRKGEGRRGLHVQSRSYWAPANIGPYSQAIATPISSMAGSEGERDGGGEEVHVAGQIPLEPAGMEVYTDAGFKGQTLLSLQHLWRIGRNQGVRWWIAGVAMISTSDDPETQKQRVRIAQAAWRAIYTRHSADEEEEEELDAWDRKNLLPTFNDATTRPALPDWSAVADGKANDSLDDPLGRSGQEMKAPPCFVAQVSELPRAADIEWCCTGLTASHISLSSSPSSANSTTRTMITRPTPHTRYHTVEIADEEVDVACVKGLGRFNYATLYATGKLGRNVVGEMQGVQWVPCERVWGEGGREVGGVVIGRVDDVEE